jgi:hypothetical protein
VSYSPLPASSAAAPAAFTSAAAAAAAAATRAAARRRLQQVVDIRAAPPHSACYGQTYIVLSPAARASSSAAGGGGGGAGAGGGLGSRMMAPRDTMFRFGNWCYCGKTSPTPASTAALARGQFGTAVAALQKQQGGLAFAGQAAAVPRSSRFATPAAAMARLVPLALAELGTPAD